MGIRETVLAHCSFGLSGLHGFVADCVIAVQNWVSREASADIGVGLRMSSHRNRPGSGRLSMKNSVREQVLVAIRAMAVCDSKSEESFVKEMMLCGFSEFDAEIMLAFVPIAFGRAVIERMPFAEGLRLSDTADVLRRDGGYTSVRLEKVNAYSTALEIARESFETAVVRREELDVMMRQSAEIDAINQAAHAKVPSLRGGVLHPPVLSRLQRVHECNAWLWTLTSPSQAAIVIRALRFKLG